MDFSAQTIILLALAAFLAGIVDAIAGGGGLICVPALLAAGLPAPLALGTNKGQSVFGSGMALLRFAKSGMIDLRMAMASFPAGFIGSLAGAALVLLVPPAALRPIIMALLFAVAIFMAVRPTTAPAPTRGPRFRPLWLAGLIALVIGAYDGFFGPGTGTFLIFAYVCFFELQLQRASAEAKVVNFASNLAAVALFASRGLVSWPLAIPMAIGQALGGYAGAHLTLRGGNKLVRLAVLVVVASLIGKLGFDIMGG